MRFQGHSATVCLYVSDVFLEVAYLHLLTVFLVVGLYRHMLMPLAHQVTNLSFSLLDAQLYVYIMTLKTKGDTRPCVICTHYVVLVSCVIMYTQCCHCVIMYT